MSSYDEAQILERQQGVLAKFGQLAIMSDDLDEILTQACHLVGEALQTDFAKVVELQENGTTLLVRAGVGWRPGIVGVVTIDAKVDTSEGHALKTGSPMISPDIATETRFRYPPFLTEHGVRAVANVIIIGGKDRPPFGILQVDSRKPRQFTERDITFLTSYANLLAAAVDRYRSMADLRAKEAEKLAAIGRLAAGVAHDFNDILQTISGCLELARDDLKEATPTYEFANVALTAAKRGSYLTHHLLSYARKQMLQPKKLDVAKFLAEMQRLLAPTLGQNIAVRVQAGDGLPGVYVDPGQFQTALLTSQ